MLIWQPDKFEKQWAGAQVTDLKCWRAEAYSMGWNTENAGGMRFVPLQVQEGVITMLRKWNSKKGKAYKE